MARALCLLICVTPVLSAQDQVAAPRNEVLNRFIGVWDLKLTFKPAKWNPEGGESVGQESTVWALKNRIIMIRDMNQRDGKMGKGLYISTHDTQKDAYPFWCFDSSGLPGTMWELKWNAEARATVGRSIDSPPAWTSGGKNHFLDGNTNLVSFWMRDENGALLMEHDGRKDRLPADREAAIVAAWKKHEPPTDLPAELKVLDRMIGTWDTVSTMKPAEWTPAGDRSTATITREWILNGRFVLNTSMHSNGDESIAIIGYDTGRKEYRSWWFNSLGHRNDSRGQWHEASKTLSYRAELDDGKTSRSSVRFVDPKTEVWQFKVTDSAGKVYFDTDITATRRAAAPAAEDAASKIKQTDRERPQGTWDLVSIVEAGKAADEEPITPEDSAIKYVFQGDRFTLLASGNAGATPQGTLKLETRGNAKTIEFVFPPDPGSTKGQSILGIYKLEADTLTICNVLPGAKLPADFESAFASKRGMTVYQRIQEKR